MNEEKRKALPNPPRRPDVNVRATPAKPPEGGSPARFSGLRKPARRLISGRGRLGGLLLLMALLTACAPAPGPAWGLADLRALDPADSSNPATDITAAYLREAGGDLQIRLDLLDLDAESRYDFLLYLRDEGTFADSPLVISIPWDGVAEVLDTGACTAGITPRVARDFRLDTVTVSLRRAGIGSAPRFDVIASTPGSSAPDDELRGLALDSPAPETTVPIILAFYHTFQGETPALTLRSWDGAHTGPRGERHGLRHLLEAAETYTVPLLLLDLQTRQNFSALDAAGILPGIQRLSDTALIGYPQGSVDPAVFFPTAGNPDFEPTMDGPSLALRAALVEAALSSQTGPFALGGDLRQSTWASPDYVTPAMAWLAARPYVQPLAAKQLHDFYDQGFTNALAWPEFDGQPLDILIADLEELLTQPADPQQAALQDIYRDSLLPAMERAAQWAENPSKSLECSDEACLWADTRFFAAFKLAGARLEFLFYHDGREVHQIIGPTAQFIAGMSDPSLWDLSLGELADLRQVMGAFADQDGLSLADYEPRSVNNGIAFVSPDGQRVKIFEFLENGLKATYEGAPTVTSIPLALDPWRRSTPGWVAAYRADGTSWELDDGPRVRIQAPVPVSIRAFSETLGWLGQPEDPDREFPPGHFVPFPMAIVDIPPMMGGTAILVEITMK